jgi:hypothetical protein
MGRREEVVGKSATAKGGDQGKDGGAGIPRPNLTAIREARAERRQGWTEEQQRIHTWQLAVTMPPLAGGITWVYGECAHLTSIVLASPTLVSVSAAVLAWIPIWVIRLRNKKTWVKTWSMHYYLSGMVASVYAAILTFTGPRDWLFALLAVATFGLSAKWYGAHRLPMRQRNRLPVLWQRRELVRFGADGELVAVDDEEDDEDEPGVGEDPPPGSDPDAEEKLTAESIIATWAGSMTSSGKGLENSSLGLLELLPHGVKLEVTLDPEKSQYGDIEGKKGRFAALLHMSPADIIVEPHPARDHSKGLLTVVTSNPLAAGIPYQGPRYHDGWIGAGLFGDGTGWGYVRVCDHKNSVFNGLVTGDPGSGKSVFLENLGMSALFSGFWKVLYLDGSEDGDSSSLLTEHMTWSEAGKEGAWKQLRAIEHYMQGRGLENKVLPKSVRGVNPSPDRMAVMWIIDELHRLLEDTKFAERLARVLRLARKKGVAIWAATQGLDLSGDFAGMAMIRTALTSKNVVTFYSASTYSHKLINGPTIAPCTLPPDGGYALLAGLGAMRGAMIRTDFSDDMTSFAEGLDEIAAWDERAWKMIGPFIEEFRVDPEQLQAQALLELEAFLGTPVALDGSPEEVAETPAGDGAVLRVQRRFPGLVLPSLPARLAIGGGEEPPKQESRAEARELNDADRAVLVAIRSLGGSLLRGGVVEKVSGRVAERTVDGVLKRLYEAGYLDQPAGKGGAYRLTAFAKEEELNWMTSENMGVVGS